MVSFRWCLQSIHCFKGFNELKAEFTEKNNRFGTSKLSLIRGEAIKPTICFACFAHSTNISQKPDAQWNDAHGIAVHLFWQRNGLESNFAGYESNPCWDAAAFSEAKKFRKVLIGKTWKDYRKVIFIISFINIFITTV